MARILLPLAMGLLLAGCFDRPATDPTTTPTTAATPVPNFVGNWSTVEGGFHLVRLVTHLRSHDAQTNESSVRESPCTTPFSYDLDKTNRTLRASRHYALHPTDPGILRVILLHELELGPRCVFKGFYGINEGASSPDICLWGIDEDDRAAHRQPWQCHLPVQPMNQVPADAWVNVTIRLTEDGHGIEVNGRAFEANTTGQASTWWDSRDGTRRFHTLVDVEALGIWPFGSVRR